jgi:uroporphyrinogen-III synthase
MKKTLYLGTSLPKNLEEKGAIHYPVLKLIPKLLGEVEDLLSHLSDFSYVLFTSKNAVQIFFTFCEKLSIHPNSCLEKRCLSIGPSTTKALREKNIDPIQEATICTQEGMWQMIERDFCLKKGRFLYPRSSLARPFLLSQFYHFQIDCTPLDLYDVAFQKPRDLPPWEEIEKIIFTSPSTIEGFFHFFPKKIPSHIQVVFQGPITEQAFYRNFKIL